MGLGMQSVVGVSGVEVPDVDAREGDTEAGADVRSSREGG